MTITTTEVEGNMKTKWI